MFVCHNHNIIFKLRKKVSTAFIHLITLAYQQISPLSHFNPQISQFIFFVQWLAAYLTTFSFQSKNFNLHSICIESITYVESKSQKNGKTEYGELFQSIDYGLEQWKIRLGFNQRWDDRSIWIRTRLCSVCCRRKVDWVAIVCFLLILIFTLQQIWSIES
jgi:hypothetical protein